jgi:hypothetical protein
MSSAAAKKDYFLNLRCLSCSKDVNAGDMKLRFTFCGCANKTCIAIFDVVLEQYLFGAVDESKVQVQLHSSKKTVNVSLKEWRTQQSEFKKKDDVFEEEFVKEL